MRAAVVEFAKRLLEGLQLILVALAERTEADKNDLKRKSAVERQLQIVTEAPYRLGDEAEVLRAGLNWRGVRGMGNLLRYGYHKVEDEIV
jgi:uncharacterized protein with HEPN domain